jgi:GntR family transcriptional regulator, phosphonate transport system regulatory protein
MRSHNLGAIGNRAGHGRQRRDGLDGRVYRAEMSVTRALRRYGLDDDKRKITRIVAALPSADDCRHLRVSRATPVLSVASIDVDPAGRPITLHETRFAGDRVQFVLES